MSLLEYAAEVIIVIIVYICSEYFLMSRVIRPLSNKLKKRWSLCVHGNVATNVPSITFIEKTEEYDDIPCQSHQQNMLKASYYTLTTMTPISGSTNPFQGSSFSPDQSMTPAMVKYRPFTSSPGLVDKYLNDNELVRCALASPLARESIEKINKDINDNTTMKASTSAATPFLSSPRLVNRFFDDIEFEREIGSPCGMVSPARDLECYGSYVPHSSMLSKH